VAVEEPPESSWAVQHFPGRSSYCGECGQAWDGRIIYALPALFALAHVGTSASLSSLLLSRPFFAAACERLWGV